MNKLPPSYTALPSVQPSQPASFPGQVIYVGAPPQQPYPYIQQRVRVFENYPSKQSRVLGAIMIVSGILCIICDADAIGLGQSVSFFACGIWGGIWFIITGSFGMSAGRMKTACKVVTFMVFCIVSSVMALVVLIFAAIAAGPYQHMIGRSCIGSFTIENPSATCPAISDMEEMQAILAGIVGILSIWGSVLCCKVACCCQATCVGEPQFISVQGNPQVFVYSQQQQGGQYVPYPESYPVQMQAGYPGPVRMNKDVGMVPSGFVNHSKNQKSPGSYNPAVGFSQSQGGDFHNTATVHGAPPNYYYKKNGMKENIISISSFIIVTMNHAPPSYTAPSGQPAPMPGNVSFVGVPLSQSYPQQQQQRVRVYENYLSKQSLVLGAIIIVAGILCIIFNSVSIALGGGISAVGYGIWGGIWFILTGSFGVSAAKIKTPCQVVTFMVLCIISSVTAFVLLILAATAAGLASSYGYGYSYNSPCGGYYYGDGYYNRYQTNMSSACQTIIAMEAMQAILAGIVGIASIWGSALCCKVACCCNTTGQILSQPQFIPIQGNQQVFFYSQQQQQGGQYVPYPGAYSVRMHAGYPGPMMMNTNVGMVPSGFVNHSTPLPPPGSYNSPVGFSQSQGGDFHNTATAPPNYEENKSGMHANM